MSDKDDNFKLDQSAQDLFKQLEGIDDTSRVDEYGASQSSLVDLLNEQTKQLDHYRILLADAICLFARILKSSSSTAASREVDQKIQDFFATLKKIAEFPEFNRKIYCRLRGQQYTSDQSGSETYDYELSFNNILLDCQMAQIIDAYLESFTDFETAENLREAMQIVASLQTAWLFHTWSEEMKYLEENGREYRDAASKVQSIARQMIKESPE